MSLSQGVRSEKLRPQRRVACLYFPLFSHAKGKCSQRERLPQLAEACYRFTPDIALRKTPMGFEAVFLEISKCLGLYQESTLLHRLVRLSERLDLYPRIAIADDAPTALAMAVFKREQARKIPIEALQLYAQPFEADPVLKQKTEKTLQVLKRLGIEDLIGFSSLPPRTLASRFGREGAQLADRIRRSYTDPWPKFKLPTRLFQKVDLDESEGLQPCTNLDSLLFLMKRPVDQVMARMRGRGKRASVIEVTFEQEAYSLLLETKRSWRFEMPVPQGTVLGLLPILRDRLSFELQRKPLQAPVVSLSFEVSEMAPGHGAQRNFFNQEEEQREAWDALVGRLSQKLSYGKTFKAEAVDRYLPEKAWKRNVQALDLKTPSLVCDSSSKQSALQGMSLSSRPSRVLPKPQRLLKLGEFLFHSRNKKRHWKTTSWVGPERLNGEWWLDAETPDGFFRDYYEVETAEGEHLWVFLNQDEVPYLHGFFD